MKKKAFICQSHVYECAAILLAETRGQAKWWFIRSHLDGDWGDVMVRRVPRYDDYESGADIPFKELIWDGWWTECSYCGMHMDETSMYEAALDIDEVIGNQYDPIYCSPDCKAEHDAEKELKDRVRNNIVQHMMWRLEDKFGKEKVSFLRDSVYYNPSTEKLTTANILVDIAGYKCEYGGGTDEMTVDEFKGIPTYPLRVLTGNPTEFMREFSL